MLQAESTNPLLAGEATPFGAAYLIASITGDTARMEGLLGELRQGRGEKAQDQAAPPATIDAGTGTGCKQEAIAALLGLTLVGKVSKERLTKMLEDSPDANPATSDIRPREQARFRHGGLTLECRDQAGQTQYAAIEVNLTATRHWVEYAILRAEYLTRFTGCPAHPVIVAAYQHPAVDDDFQAGRVLWYQVEEADFLPPPHLR